jgi:hypothetical protein
MRERGREGKYGKNEGSAEAAATVRVHGGTPRRMVVQNEANLFFVVKLVRFTTLFGQCWKLLQTKMIDPDNPCYCTGDAKALRV